LQYRQALSGQKAVLKTVERDQLVGESPRFLQCLDMLAKAAQPMPASLFPGSQNGQGGLCRAIHANSRRRSGNFVVVDCTALPEQLVESVLFGHVKGAYTGADRANRGLIRHADKGERFFSTRSAKLPLATQKSSSVPSGTHLLSGGQPEECHSDFRLNLRHQPRSGVAMTEKGVFREDLLYRLRGLSLHLPPLRERDGDIPPGWWNHFLSRLCSGMARREKSACPIS
jgi:two-component system NtrC family response regulator